MVLLIIIPFLNGYFIGKINPTFSDKPGWTVDGMGWDGMGWDGMGWDGMGYALKNGICLNWISMRNIIDEGW